MQEKKIQSLKALFTLLNPIIALVPVFIATLLHWNFGFLIHPYVWLLFYPAIFLCAWIGGLWFNLISMLLTFGLACYLFIDLKYLIPILIVKIYVILLFLLVPGAFFFWKMKKANQKLIAELTQENIKLKEEIGAQEKKFALILKESKGGTK